MKYNVYIRISGLCMELEAESEKKAEQLALDLLTIGSSDEDKMQIVDYTVQDVTVEEERIP